MKIGTYYYPEQWPRGDWERDFDGMAAMGMEVVHLAEFAWHTLEPEAGRFEFGWLDDVLKLARDRGMDAILCTPTAAPPVWLTRDHPEVLPTRDGGGRGRHGGRRHYNPLSPALHEATTRIVAAMASHFGGRDGVVGWQIDNEFGSAFGSGEGFDQAPLSHEAFRRWLRRKFGDIGSLNAAWGNEFWNTYYSDFGEILLPTTRNAGYANPHHHLDAARFWSDAFARYCKLQADLLKPHVGGRFITHNFMPFHADCDPGDFEDSLSLWGWDAYPVTGWGGPFADESYRLADPGWYGFVHDQMASHSGRWALLEVQPGQTNWSGFPVKLPPGAVRLWLWTALAHGAEFITVYRYRQPLVGQEQHHDGLVGHDGVTLTPGGEDFKTVAAEVRQLRERGVGQYYRTLRPVKPPTVGILFDFDERWINLAQPHATDFDYPRLCVQWHSAFEKLGLDVRVLRPDRPLPDGLKIVVAAGMQMMGDETVARLHQFADAGGQVVLTCRTAHKDRHGRVRRGPTAGPILGLIGGRIDGYDCLPPGMFGEVEHGGDRHRWRVWGDQVVPESAEVVATYADQFYAGAAAVTANAVGRGRVTYHAVFDEGTLTDAVARRVAGEAGLETVDLPDRCRLFRREGATVAVNYGLREVEVAGRTVPRAGATVW